MTLDVYVAGGSSELARCRAVIEALRGIANVRITHDWTADVEAARAAGYASDAAVPIEVLRAHARRDLAAVWAADLVVVLPPAAPSRGMQTELGIALALDTEILAVRGELGIFGALVEAWVADDAAAIDAVRARAGGEAAA